MCNGHILGHLLVSFQQKPFASVFSTKNIISEFWAGRVCWSLLGNYFLCIHTYPQYFVTRSRYTVNWSPWLWSLYTTFKCQANSPEALWRLSVMHHHLLTFHNARPSNLLFYVCFAPVAAAVTGHCLFGCALNLWSRWHVRTIISVTALGQSLQTGSNMMNMEISCRC